MEKGKAIVFSSRGEDYMGDLANNKKNSASVFIDRSKVRILLWDRDTKSSEEVSALLCSCSYKVNSVRSASEVIEFLKAEGPHIDILLAEVHFPVDKNMKTLTHIMREKELRHIPVIMLSTQAEISIVVKCLRLGAADYLLKPLRSNEILHLWTHMWRKRRMLGLPQKNIAVYDTSDTGKFNLNNAILLSEETGDDSRRSA